VTDAPQHRSIDEIRDWIVASLATLLELDPGEIDPTEPVTALGIDSMQYLGMIGDLEDWLGCRFTDNPLIDYPTVSSLAEFVAGQLQLGRTTLDPQATPQ